MWQWGERVLERLCASAGSTGAALPPAGVPPPVTDPMDIVVPDLALSTARAIIGMLESVMKEQVQAKVGVSERRHFHRRMFLKFHPDKFRGGDGDDPERVKEFVKVFTDWLAVSELCAWHVEVAPACTQLRHCRACQVKISLFKGLGTADAGGKTGNLPETSSHIGL